MATNKDQAVVVRMDAPLHNQLREVSERDERTVAQTVRLAVKQYLAKDDQQVAAAG